VATREELAIRLYERVVAVRGSKEDFTVVTDRGEHAARHVVIATGFFDLPNRLGVPGDDLPKVTHYYDEPYRYVRQQVAVIGAKNSAAKAALDCYRHGAGVTLIVRAPALSDKIKYWIRPDLENRIKEGSIRAYFDTAVEAIHEGFIVLRTSRGTEQIPNDWVLAMTGYHPDYRFLEALDIAIADDAFRTPVFDQASFETSRPGVYLAGTVCGGYHTSRWFIENGRFHARQIVKHIIEGHADAIAFDAVHWKTEE
jgi:thioredoxin reductase (NADPH)